MSWRAPDYYELKQIYPRATDYIEELLEESRQLCLEKLNHDQKNILIERLVLDMGHDLDASGDDAAFTTLAGAIRGSKVMLTLYLKTIKENILKNYNKSIENIFIAVADKLEIDRITRLKGYQSDRDYLIASDNRDRAAAIRAVGGRLCSR